MRCAGVIQAHSQTAGSTYGHTGQGQEAVEGAGGGEDRGATEVGRAAGRSSLHHLHETQRGAILVCVLCPPPRVLHPARGCRRATGEERSRRARASAGVDEQAPCGQWLLRVSPPAGAASGRPQPCLPHHTPHDTPIPSVEREEWQFSFRAFESNGDLKHLAFSSTAGLHTCTAAPRGACGSVNLVCVRRGATQPRPASLDFERR